MCVGAGVLSHRYTWTPRHCCLTKNGLRYYTHEGGALKGTIHLTTCTLQSFEVMPVDCPNTGRSVATGWRFAIQTPAKRYILAAMSERDLYGWLHALKGVVVMLNEESRTDPVPSRPPRAALIRRWFRLL
ncbi:hypothetical protein H310_14202 [Aphanomyces invadans]|uniref:PH domain-containing protein n=1 Tax=Aphanomyces invadans TaxID=157072 RepID=A0A024TCW5_9STRA|nr:hypothetical protein H310_14202 [Aphanomyces invadans]ETV91202.1 hypothetical protein H310_14202 [Aphanomyces invadans]|eukprot:XP_008880233.1 hypothetical protein H310_14202 [Aphanomyces invadans]